VDPLEAELFKRMKLMGNPPYKAEWEQKYERARSELHREARPAASPIKVCRLGFPTVLDSPTPEGMFQAPVTPEETLFLFRDGEVRQIYTDGRSHPKPEDLWPTEMGDSIGHWEGTTLAIDTIARTAGSIAPGAFWVAADLSEQAHFTERLRSIDDNMLQDDLTIEDPLRFARPWHVSIRYKRVTDVDRMIPSNCTENDRNPIVNGKLTIAPP
jgi:hypothetical protein